MQLADLYRYLNDFDFTRLFVEELGWSRPADRGSHDLQVKDCSFTFRHLAELGGVVVLGVTSHADEGRVPDAVTRLAIHKALAKLHHENLLIFTDKAQTQSLWFWVKREDGRLEPRNHLYVKGQPADLFLSKLQALQFDLAELDAEGSASVVEVAQRLRKSLDVEAVTKRFFKSFQEQHIAFLELIEGIDDERDRRWYASVLLNRLMFVWFLQKKGFIDNQDFGYLDNKFRESQQRGADRFYSEFLQALFFEGFAKPEDQRSAAARKLLGKVRYLNGGLFLPHRVEQANGAIRIPDHAFANLFKLFRGFSWNLDDRPAGQADEINPDVLGYIFEKYINQKAFGAYYTRPEITRYLCEQTIHRLILDQLNEPAAPEFGLSGREYDTLEELLLNLDAPLCSRLVRELLPKLSLLDPACGSGAFLVAAMKTLVNIYFAVIGHIKRLHHPDLDRWLAEKEGAHRNLAYHINKTIITDNLYGVDIMEEAAEIARLRLFLALVACARSVDEIEPLPNIDFNILTGNSLIGLLHVEAEQYEREKSGDLFRKSYRQVVDEKNRAIDTYRHTASFAEDLRDLRDKIEAHHREARAVLDHLLLLDFDKLGVKFEQTTWDGANNRQGKPKKRKLTQEDIAALKPFHWGYEFDQILDRGGFDAILTNPPWEAVKPQAKEFFERHSALVTKKKMDIKAFEKEQARLLKDPEIRAAWLQYLDQFPHQSTWFRNAPLYTHQSSIANGKKTGSDLNLYKLFTEQCISLLRKSGRLGIVIPSGIYTDLGAKGLRELLFDGTQITGMFGFENRKLIFEGVHRSFKFVVLTCIKGGLTEQFPAAFMRHEVAELDHFPRDGALQISVELVKRLSPDSLSVMEFKSGTDIAIAEKMLRFPLLGEQIDGAWNLRLTAEFHMTNDGRRLFETAPGPGRLPLYEGKMIWQFDAYYEKPRYWVDEQEGRAAVLGRTEDKGQSLDYQAYRLGFRDIASNTNERTMVATLIPPTFHGNKLPTVRPLDANGEELISSMQQIFLCAIWNSFTVDWMLRMKVTTTLNFFYVLQLPAPRLSASQSAFEFIVDRAARLSCTTPEFDALAREAGLRDHRDGATDPTERARLRAELDGMVAHLYGLTEAEFTHILGTFPLVAQDVKDATLTAFRALAPADGKKPH